MPLTPLRRPSLRRTSLITVLVLLALSIAWFIAALALFVFPRQESLHKADAIVSLSPPRERLPAALKAFEDEMAPHLWISHVPRDIESSDDRLIDELCRGAKGSDVTCFRPASHDTIGEARAASELVNESVPQSVIVVTHTSHSTRARYLFERCLPRGTQVQLLLVDEPDSFWFRFERMLYETGAFVKAFAEATKCSD